LPTSSPAYWLTSSYCWVLGRDDDYRVGIGWIIRRQMLGFAALNANLRDVSAMLGGCDLAGKLGDFLGLAY
jgi:hypothetical protein